MSGVILQIDFEKAYDNVSWKFMFDILGRYGFGKDFLRWIHILYNDSQSAVQNNGHLTKFFPLKRGVHQGCPLSGVIFVLIVEVLSAMLKEKKEIKGLNIRVEK